MTHTHILMTTCHSADEVAAAGRPGLEAAAEWGIENHSASVLLGNLSKPCDMPAGCRRRHS